MTSRFPSGVWSFILFRLCDAADAPHWHTVDVNESNLQRAIAERFCLSFHKMFCFGVRCAWSVFLTWHILFLLNILCACGRASAETLIQFDLQGWATLIAAEAKRSLFFFFSSFQCRAVMRGRCGKCGEDSL